MTLFKIPCPNKIEKKCNVITTVRVKVTMDGGQKRFCLIRLKFIAVLVCLLDTNSYGYEVVFYYGHQEILRYQW